MRNLLVVVAGLLVCAGSFAAAGALSRPINDQRKELNLTVADEVYDLPPEMAVMQAALGTFRGVALNFAWQRAEELKNDGKYYEAVDLGKLITRLQPKFPRVWEFVSWNQAYNISVATHTAPERWFWVKSGIDALQHRGGGLDANPNSVRLYQQLAWIYHHKLGMFQDNFNWYYKRKLADEWNSILGEPPVVAEVDVPEGTSEGEIFDVQMRPYLDWLRPVVDAPDSAADLPEGARRLVAWLGDQGYGAEVRTLRDFTVATEPVDDDPAAAAEGDFYRARQQWPDWATAQDVAATVAYLRRAVLTDAERNMDPALMLADAAEFGPLDWRHPAAHAIYWARRGLERLEAQEIRSPEGLLNTRRQIFNSLEQLAQQGRVVYQPESDPDGGFVSYVPMWSFWLEFEEYLNTLIRENDPESMEKAYGTGFRNRMDEAIFMADVYGDRPTALRLLARLRDRYAGTPVDHYGADLDAFVRQQSADTIDNPGTARNLVSVLLQQAQVAFYVQNDRDRAEELVEKAKEIHDGYRERNPNPAEPLYQEMPDFEVMQLLAVGALLSGQSTQPGPLGAAQVPVGLRSEIWRRMPEPAREFVWPNFAEAMLDQAYAAGYEPLAVFPPPPRVQAELERLQALTRPERMAVEDRPIESTTIETDTN